MRRLRHLTIASKIYAVVGALALVAIAMGLLGISAMHMYGQKVLDMRNASQRAMTGERINGLINAVVMDSRGVYMARDRAEVDKFGQPLLAGLEAIGSAFDAWKALLPPDRRPEMEKAERDIRSFITYRRELVRIGQEEGNPAAREYGDNDANRSNRSALNREIQTLARENNREIDRLGAELDAFYHRELMLLAGLGAAALAITGVAVLTLRKRVLRPIADLTAVMRRLAENDMAAEIRGTDRRDELGTMASAVAVFKQSMIAGRKAEGEREAEREAKEARAARLAALVQAFEGKAEQLVGHTAAAATGCKPRPKA